MQTELGAKALLCDYATIAGGKLFITGANINLIGIANPEPPHPVQVALGIVVTIPWNATNQAHTLSIELISDAGGGASERVPLSDSVLPGQDESNVGLIAAAFNVGRSPMMKPGEESLMPVAIPLMGLPLPRPGSYFFDIKIDGTPVDRVSFRAELATQQFMAGFPPLG